MVHEGGVGICGPVDAPGSVTAGGRGLLCLVRGVYSTRLMQKGVLWRTNSTPNDMPARNRQMNTARNRFSAGGRAVTDSVFQKVVARGLQVTGINLRRFLWRFYPYLCGGDPSLSLCA